MKILQVVRQYLPGTGGMETYVSNLCRHLAGRGIHTDVATLDYIFKTNERLPAYERIDGTNVIRLPSAGTPRYFLAPRLLKLLPRYDLIHVHGVDFFVDLLGMFKGAHGKPVVLSTHGGFFHTDWFASLKKAYFQTVTHAALKGVDRVIACSPQDEALFRKVSSRVFAVENGIDYRRFASVKKEVSPGKLLFIGRISKNKRVDRLIAALALLRESAPEASLTVTGPDWEGLGEGLKRQAAELGLDGRVRFTGVLSAPEMLNELATAHLFVSASEYEAFGLSTVEAMASRTVTVVNKIRAFQDIIEDGKTGFLTDFGDTKAAAEKLRLVLNKPADELEGIGEKAGEKVAVYDWTNVVGEIVGIYEEVLHNYGSQDRWH